MKNKIHYFKFIGIIFLLICIYGCQDSLNEPKAEGDYFPLSIGKNYKYTYKKIESVSGALIIDDSWRWNNEILVNGNRTWEIIKKQSFNDYDEYMVKDIFNGTQTWNWMDNDHNLHRDTSSLLNVIDTFYIKHDQSDSIYLELRMDYFDIRPYYKFIPIKRYNDINIVTDTIKIKIPTNTTMYSENNYQIVVLNKGLESLSYTEGRTWQWSEYNLKLETVISP